MIGGHGAEAKGGGEPAGAVDRRQVAGAVVGIDVGLPVIDSQLGQHSRLGAIACRHTIAGVVADGDVVGDGLGRIGAANHCFEKG